MIELFREARDVQAFVSAAGWPFCFIDGVALQHWGEPRATRDLDVSVFTWALASARSNSRTT